MTRLQFLSYVIRVFKRTDKDTEIYEALNETIKDVVSRHPFSDYDFQSYVSTTVGQEDYTLPATLLYLRHPIRMLDGNLSTDSGRPLTFLTKEQYDALEPNPNRANPDTGKPSHYTIFSNQILLYPIPDSASYLLEINWGKGHGDVELTSGDQTASLGSHWDEVLKWGVLFRVYASVEQHEVGEYWRNLYEGATPGGNGGAIGRLIRVESAKKNTEIGLITPNNL